MQRFPSTLVALLLVLVPAAPVLAQAPAPDTARHTAPFFTYRDALLLGAFAAGALAMDPLDVHIAHQLQDPNNQNNRFLHNSATFFRWMGQPAPQIIGVGLYVVGRVTHAQKVELLAVHGTEAMLLTNATTTAIKFLAGRARPSLDPNKHLGFSFLKGFKGYNFQSFPSGHTATAFAVASAGTAEFSHWIDQWHDPDIYKFLVGGVLYGGASLVGMSRMYNNAHWTSDVVAGAAIGTLFGIKTVRYNYRHPHNKVERWLVKLQVVPGRGTTPTMIGIGFGPSPSGLGGLGPGLVP